jgi:hypothetical protein
MGKLNEELKKAIPFNIGYIESFGEKQIKVSGKYDDIYRQYIFVDHPLTPIDQTNAIIEEAKNIITHAIDNAIKGLPNENI